MSKFTMESDTGSYEDYIVVAVTMEIEDQGDYDKEGVSEHYKNP